MTRLISPPNDELFCLSARPARARSVGMHGDIGWSPKRLGWKLISASASSGRSPFYLGKRACAQRLPTCLHHERKRLFRIGDFRSEIFDRRRQPVDSVSGRLASLLSGSKNGLG